MENWLSTIREIWLLHGRDIKRYGLCLWCLIVGLARDRIYLAWLGLAAALCMFAYDRWGQPWAERGRLLLKSSNPKDPSQ